MNPLPEYISEEALQRFVRDALAEDVGAGDVTTEAVVDGALHAEGCFLAKADGVLAGLTMAEYVFSAVDSRIRCSWTYEEGESVRAGATFGEANGPAQGLARGRTPCPEPDAAHERCRHAYAPLCTGR